MWLCVCKAWTVFASRNVSLLQFNRDDRQTQEARLHIARTSHLDRSAFPLHSAF